jgi:hypothetical protein
MQARLKQYVKERDDMLKKCDVSELEKFIASHAEFYPVGFADRFTAAREEVKKCTLHKMIVNAPKLPQDLREKSAFWLTLHGYNLTIK